MTTAVTVKAVPQPTAGSPGVTIISSIEGGMPSAGIEYTDKVTNKAANRVDMDIVHLRSWSSSNRNVFFRAYHVGSQNDNH